MHLFFALMISRKKHKILRETFGMSPFWAQWYTPSDVDEHCLDLQSKSYTWCGIWIQLQCTFLFVVFWDLHLLCVNLAIVLICILYFLYFLQCQFGSRLQFNEIILICSCIARPWWSKRLSLHVFHVLLFANMVVVCNLMRSFSFTAALFHCGGPRCDWNEAQVQMF